MDKNKEELEQLKSIVKNRGLKYTKQREIIFQAILDTTEHLNAEELHQRIAAKWPEEKIGIATVYRALSFLEDVKLISSIDLQNNEGKKFEANNTKHHDHLICMNCNKIVEFVKTVNNIIEREKCYNCYRPKSSCMCQYFTKIDTQTKFILLMHPKEFQKTKNTTGYFTHRSLPNSLLFKGIDFSNHQQINAIIEDENNDCYCLYPGESSIEINSRKLPNEDKRKVIFIIDSTWPCSKKILAMSKNIASLPKISFQHKKSSQYKIKTQPNKFCLSTIESTLCVLEILNKQGIESLEKESLEKFITPFEKMVEYQVSCSKEKNVRFKPAYKR